MSGKPWTEERKAAWREVIRRRWRDGTYAARRPALIDERERAARSGRMARLNIRMSYDDDLKRRCVRGQKRTRRSPGYVAVQSAVMKDLMSRPEMRRAAKFHCVKINKNPRTRKRQLATRRRKKGAQS